MTFEKKMHKVVPEDLYRVAQIVDILRAKYGPTRAAFMLEQVANSLRTGKYPGGRKPGEHFVGF